MATEPVLRTQLEAGAEGDPAPDARVTVFLTRPESQVCEHIDPSRISDLLPVAGALLWVDIRNPGPDELDMLREEFGFHGLALEDVANQGQRPKVDEYPDYFFVVMYAPLPGEGLRQLQTEEVDLFVGKNFVVTCHQGEIPSLQDAARRWERTEPELRKQVGFLLHVIADSIIDSYFPVTDALEDRLDRLELSMFGKRSRFDPEEVLILKRTLYTLRKAIYPMREVFNTFLRRDQIIFSAETYPYFQDAYDHVLRLLDTIDIERDMATGALEAQLSVTSNRLNETMQRLTVIAVCVAVMGAVFGAWGMNFDEVPLHHLGVRGFAILCGGATGLVGLALLVTKRLGLW
jgi:magnesium transporter